jgi:hypothetical protein
MQGKPAGIKRLDNLAGGHGNAGRIPSFNNNDSGNPEIAKCPLQYTSRSFKGIMDFSKLASSIFFVRSTFSNILPPQPDTG